MTENFILKQLLVINEIVKRDPVLVRYMQMLFDWANEAGLKGQKVWDLTIVEPEAMNPFRNHCQIWCKMGCTEEQMKNWETRREILVKQAVMNALSDEDEIEGT
jgi:hypothetical protein